MYKFLLLLATPFYLLAGNPDDEQGVPASPSAPTFGEIQMGEYENKIRILENEKRDLRKQIVQLNSDNASLQHIAQLQRQEYNEIVAELTKKLESHENKILNLAEQLKEAEIKLSVFEKTVSREDIYRYQREKENLKTEISHHRREANRVRQKLMGLKDHFANAYNEKLYRMEEQLEKDKKRIAQEKEKKILETQEIIERMLQKAAAELTNIINDSAKEVKVLSSLFQAKESSFSKVKSNIEQKVYSSMTYKDMKRDELRHEGSRLVFDVLACMNAPQSAYSQLLVKVKELKKQFTQKEKELSSLKEQYQQIEDENKGSIFKWFYDWRHGTKKRLKDRSHDIKVKMQEMQHLDNDLKIKTEELKDIYVTQLNQVYKVLQKAAEDCEALQTSCGAQFQGMSVSIQNKIEIMEQAALVHLKTIQEKAFRRLNNLSVDGKVFLLGENQTYQNDNQSLQTQMILFAVMDFLEAFMVEKQKISLGGVALIAQYRAVFETYAKEVLAQQGQAEKYISGVY